MEKPELTIDAGMEMDLAEIGKPNYLGSSEVIQFLIRTLAQDALKRRHAPPTEESASVQDVKQCDGLADVLLGHSSAFTPMTGWNEPGKIDVFLGQQARVIGDTPMETVAAALVQFLIDIYKLYNYAAAGALPEQWEFQVDAICHSWTQMLLGVVPPTISAAMMAE